MAPPTCFPSCMRQLLVPGLAMWMTNWFVMVTGSPPMKYLLLSEDLLATYEMENERKNEKEEKGERKRVFVEFPIPSVRHYSTPNGPAICLF